MELMWVEEEHFA